eukprot:5619365-Prymnesium_polylepis.1
MAIAPPDSLAALCSKLQCANEAAPPDANTAPPCCAAFPQKTVRSAVTSPAMIRRAPPSIASHASKRQSYSASDAPETSIGAF